MWIIPLLVAAVLLFVLALVWSLAPKHFYGRLGSATVILFPSDPTRKAEAERWIAPHELTAYTPRDVKLDSLRTLRVFSDFAGEFGLWLLAVGWGTSQYLQHHEFPLADWNEIFTAILIFLMFVSSLPGIFFLSRTRYLVKYGTPTRGVITAATKKTNFAGRIMELSVRYEFVLPDGVQSTSTEASHESAGKPARNSVAGWDTARGAAAFRRLPSSNPFERLPPVGTLVTILVDPADPRRNVPYEICPYRVADTPSE